MNFFKQKIINTEEASEAEKSVTEKNSDENRTEPAAPPQEEVQVYVQPVRFNRV